MGEVEQVGVGGGEGRRVGRVAVDDRAHVVAPAVDLGMQHRLEMHLVGGIAQVGVQIELDHVGGGDLRQGHSAALDPHPLRPLGIAGADVAQRQVLIALVGEDAAGPGHLLAHGRQRALAGHRHPLQRRSVGG